MDSGVQCLDSTWVLTSAFFPRKARINTDRNCNVMMTLWLGRRHDDAVRRLGAGQFTFYITPSSSTGPIHHSWDNVHIAG